MSYSEFLASKVRRFPDSGFDVPPGELNPHLKPFQCDICRWALRRGKAGLFLNTGLGKTITQLEWASQVCRRTGGNVLLLAPLSVGRQTAAEAERFGIPDVKFVREPHQVEPGITVCNYERLHKFDVSQFVGIVLDESSVLKSLGGKTSSQVIESFQSTPYRLACTATPAPNDAMELGNHAEFLGAMRHSEMLSMFFTHDGSSTSKWRLRGHADTKFYEWMAGWSVMIRRPSDLGYEDSEYELPPLHIHEHIVETTGLGSIMEKHGRQLTLIKTEAKTLQDQRQARRETIDSRADLLAKIVQDSGERFVVWCNLNQESEAAARRLALSGGVEITGSNSTLQKEQKLDGFLSGQYRHIVTKPKIAGFGLNWQHVSHMAFLGLGHSYEDFKQCIARCYRFGQQKPVHVHIILSDRDASVLANVRRKQSDHDSMIDGMVEAMGDLSRREIGSTGPQKTEYRPDVPLQLPAWVTA